MERSGLEQLKKIRPYIWVNADPSHERYALLALAALDGHDVTTAVAAKDTTVPRKLEGPTIE